MNLKGVFFYSTFINDFYNYVIFVLIGSIINQIEKVLKICLGNPSPSRMSHARINFQHESRGRNPRVWACKVRDSS